MNLNHKFAGGIILSLLVTVSLVSAGEISDPYEILNLCFEKLGGLARLKAEQASYSEGTLSLGGMEGSIKAWNRKPSQSRVEVILGPLNIIQGDNGEHKWVVDQNGKLQVITNPDEAAIKRRQVKRLMEEYAYVERASDIFRITLEGIEQVDGKECYVIKVTNNINFDSFTSYIATETFLQEKVVYVEDIQSRDVFYGDYREIQGLLIPFWTKEVAHETGQVQELSLTHYESNPDIDPTMFDPPEQGAKDYHFVEGNCAQDIPFEFIGGHLYIPVTIGGKERLWILDTGAPVTVLNKAFAEELGLELEGDIKGRGAGGTVDASFTTLPPFSITGVRFQEQTVAVVDMNELIKRLGLDMVGVLGFDFLSRFVTKVDFADELVSFYDPETFEYHGDGHILEIHMENGAFEVPATLDGIHSGNWLFDIGAGTTHLDGRYAKREDYADKNGVLAMGHGAGNEYQRKDVRCDSIQFAGFTVYEPIISFSYGGSDTTFTADRIGMLGNSLFRNFVIYCDYAGERLIVEKGNKFNQSWPTDNSGLQIAWGNNRKIEVLYVAPDTPAKNAGFLKGDIVKTINGIDVGLFDGIIAIRKLLTSAPNTVYEFIVDRAGTEKKLNLRLAELR
jgi:hypothetical protein